MREASAGTPKPIKRKNSMTKLTPQQRASAAHEAKRKSHKVNLRTADPELYEDRESLLDTLSDEHGSRVEGIWAAVSREVKRINKRKSKS